MASTSQIPASKLVKQGIGIDDVQEGRKTKDQYRKQKDLEEEQKLGIAPATVDVVTGRDINPHIPEFIAKHPWYVPAEGPTLHHQRPHAERQIKWSSIDDWYKRGTTNQSATKFREGACENCGAMTHKRKDCVERPRKIGAKWSNDEIAPDEFLQPSLTMGWDAKRDRWNGYDPQTYKQVVEEHEKLEQTRKMLKQEKMKGEDLKEELESAVVIEQPADEDMYADDADMAGVTVDMDSRTRITVRNLRIREDTAKYLYNLDPDGPYYDPKSRSMRENPFLNLPGKEKDSAKFSGENFIRYTGEVVEANEAQVFAWQARCKGIDVHALAEPTKLEAMKKEYEQQKVESKDEHKNKLLEKYGGEEYLRAPSKELLLSQNEVYVEYNRKGQVIKGDERPVIQSRYEEDRYINNHTSVWGSFWKHGKWGYACCHGMLKNSYCIGKVEDEDEEEEEEEESYSKTEIVATVEEPETAKVEFTEAADQESESAESSESSETSSSDEELQEERRKDLERREREEKKRKRRREKRKRQKERKTGKTSSKRDKSRRGEEKSDESSSSDEDEDEEERKKKALKKAIKRAEKDWMKAEDEIQMGDRKRKYASNYDTKAPTEAEIEAYRLTTIHASDPMADYMTEKRKK